MSNPRRHIHWDRIGDLRGRASLLIGTALGAGLSPIAPGTAGTIVAIPLAWAIAPAPDLARAALWVALLAAGTWAAKIWGERMETADHQSIVIDEVVGYGISAWTAGRDWKALAAAFVLFRFFDIIKPPPCRQADRWSKNGSSWVQGFGVMFDDVLAGFYALAFVMLLQKLGWTGGV